MDSNINVLVNAKDSYTNQLKSILTPPKYTELSFESPAPPSSDFL